MNEKELIEASKKGGHDSFSKLITLHKQKIFATLLGITRNPEEAKDLTQDVFIRAYRKIDKFEGKSSFYTWIYRIAVNMAIDFKRKKSKRVMIEIDEEKGGIDVLLAPRLKKEMHGVYKKEIKDQILLAIEELSPTHRAVIQMREIEGMKYDEIAKALNINKGTVMSRLHHGRKKIKEALINAGIEP